MSTGYPGSYLDNNTNRQGLERFAGVTLTKPGSRHIVQKPGGKNGISRIRLYPYVEGGVEKPLRLEPHLFRDRYGSSQGPTCDFAFYPWMALEEIIQMGGTTSKFTAFVRVRDKDPRHPGPFQKFFRGMRQALKNNPVAYPRDWADWIANKGALPSIEAVGLVQGILYAQGGKTCTNAQGKEEPQHPVLFILPKTARESLEQLCNMRYPASQPDCENFDQVFPYNNLVNSQKGSCLQVVYNPPTGRNTAYYEVKVEEQPFALPASLVQEFVPWQNLLQFMTEQDQMSTLASHFPPEALDLIFGNSEYATLLPPGVKGRWDAFVRGGAGAYQQPQPQYGYVPAGPVQAPPQNFGPPPVNAAPQQQWAPPQQPNQQWQPTQPMPPQPPMPPAPPTAPAAPMPGPGTYMPQPPMMAPQTMTAPVPPMPPTQPSMMAPPMTLTAPALPPGAPPMPSAPMHGASAVFNSPTVHQQFVAPAAPPVQNVDPTADQASAVEVLRARIAAAQKANQQQ